MTRIDAAMLDGPPVASPVRKQLDRVKSAEFVEFVVARDGDETHPSSRNS